MQAKCKKTPQTQTETYERKKPKATTQDKMTTKNCTQ